jgi:hypothetical protein
MKGTLSDKVWKVGLAVLGVILAVYFLAGPELIGEKEQDGCAMLPGACQNIPGK